ncbi:MAG: histidinol-phosphatase HisJ family protein [Clostridia bacterium]|nr:histidinol-phosphatase HisJ family protein [Clostridia bacterium]
MLLIDCHVHSRHSFDSRSTLDAICAAALAAGVGEVCLAEHIEPHHPDPRVDVPPVYGDWLADIARAREAFPGVALWAGIEIGDNPPHRDEIYRTLDALPLDFRLLSLHLVDNVDCYDAAFFEGRTRREAYAHYAKAKLESALHFDDYDAVAHLGFCGKFAPYPPEERLLRWQDAPDHIDALLRHIAQRGRALEINTSGLRRMDSTIPGEDILRRFAELGGEFVTLGSDAHTPDTVGYRLDDARRLAISAGIRWGVRYVARKPVPYALGV